MRFDQIKRLVHVVMCFKHVVIRCNIESESAEKSTLVSISGSDIETQDRRSLHQSQF
jgi:hypothetical protein